MLRRLLGGLAYLCHEYVVNNASTSLIAAIHRIIWSPELPVKVPTERPHPTGFFGIIMIRGVSSSSTGYHHQRDVMIVKIQWLQGGTASARRRSPVKAKCESRQLWMAVMGSSTDDDDDANDDNWTGSFHPRVHRWPLSPPCNA